MSTAQAGFALQGGNPDVLTCIANLSNDEVFTPPELANRMLDTVAEAWAIGNDGADVWAEPGGGCCVERCGLAAASLQG